MFSFGGFLGGCWIPFGCSNFHVLRFQLVKNGSDGDNASEWPEDAQIYQPLLGQMTLPEQAKCYGIEALLRLQNLKYDLVMRSNAEYISPSGKVPLLRIDDEVVSEESILSWLQKKVNEIKYFNDCFLY
ncbi:metaxin-2-like [Rhopilema esculentum]|uniref:metaxin-2-like n=1 Tax=Rhopilema esculentum TaxID=499914 RepID=UPI0031D71C6C